MRSGSIFALCLLIGGQQALAQEDSDMKTQTQARSVNRLAKATSPYLLQHAHNPVDWYEWGEEAFAKARNEDKPIFLSIGYAACHWCHVMEHECFEVDEVAAVLNEHFVSIKVDREERPDIDELYMAYTQAATGHGGWPMSVFLTPEAAPFHAGTYFPREQFVSMLQQIGQMWQLQRDDILKGASGARKFFEQWAKINPAAEGVMPLEAVDATATALSKYFDRDTGGKSGGGSNKFPPSMAMDLLLRVHRRTGNADLAQAVNLTLDHMARGGIYDHVGGGICRYSTDTDWLVPHFEKMLYDQAMVSAIYLDGYLALKKPQYAAVARDIFDYVLDDLSSPEGGFYSSRDADSEGLEGKFYIWTVTEITSILGEEEGRLFCKYYDVTDRGNWFERMGHAPAGPKNILHISQPPEEFAKSQNIEVEEFKKKLPAWREKMRAVRGQRVAPGLDDKILTDWNGLMIASLAKGAAILDEPKYAKAAARAADFVLTKMQKDGRLLRTYRAGEARLTANLSDYSFLIEGLLNLYEATFERRWLDEAVRLTDISIRYYFDEKGGGFFFTASDGEKLLVRSKQPHDSAIPAGNSVHALNLQRLAILLGRKDLREKAETIFRAFAPQAVESPGAYERLMCAADFYHDTVKEIAIIGDLGGMSLPPYQGGTKGGRQGEAPAEPLSPSPSQGEGWGEGKELRTTLNDGYEQTRALLRTVYGVYLPNKVVVFSPDKVTDERIPLLTGKARINNRPTVYVCENFRCQTPVQSHEQLLKQLERKPVGR